MTQPQKPSELILMAIDLNNGMYCQADGREEIMNAYFSLEDELIKLAAYLKERGM